MTEETIAVAPPRQGRGFSTRYEDHKGLMYRFAMRCYARVRGSGISALEFDDVLSEMSVSYTKALKSYDPARGITFSAYLGRCCFNDFNKLMEKLELEQFGRKLPYSPKSVRKALSEMNESERSAFALEVEAAAHKPKPPPEDMGRTRHYGLGLINMSDLTGVTPEGVHLDALEYIETDEDEDGLSAPERYMEAKRKVMNLRADETLLPETRNYIRHMLGFTVSDEGMKRIKDKGSAVRKELADRYGIKLNMLRL